MGDFTLDGFIKRHLSDTHAISILNIVEES